MDINPDIRAVIEPELLPGERLLWAQPRNKSRKLKKLFSGFFGYGAVFLLLLACGVGGFSAFNGNNLPVFLLCAGGMLGIVWIVYQNTFFPDDTSSNGVMYGITDKRILALNNKGDCQSVLGRPFFALFKVAEGNYHRISLIGPGLDEDIFEFHFENIEHPDEAHKLILENFMQVKDKPHE